MEIDDLVEDPVASRFAFRMLHEAKRSNKLPFDLLIN